MSFLSSIVSGISHLFHTVGNIGSSAANSAKNMTEGIVLKIIEYFITQFMNYIFQFITDLITYMVNIFFNFAYSFEASTVFLGVIGFPVFIIVFALVGGIVYLIFRVVEGLL